MQLTSALLTGLVRKEPYSVAFDLTNVIVVVTRYFGGTQLGVGGLSRAYGKVAASALDRARLVTRYHTVQLEATFPHANIGGVMHVVSREEAKILDTVYDEDVHTLLEIRASKADQLKTRLIDHTRGNISLKVR